MRKTIFTLCSLCWGLFAVSLAWGQSSTCFSFPALSGLAESQLIVPLSVSNGSSILSVEATVSYPADRLKAVSVTKGTMASGMALMANVDTPGLVRVAMAGASPISGNGVLFRVSFDLTGSPGDALPVQLPSITINDVDLSGCITNGTITIRANTPPVARAGADRSVDEGSTVTLDGSLSTDTDDGIVSYLWEKMDGPEVTLSSASSAKATFTAPDVGPSGASLTFRLTVTDKHGLTSQDTCTVAVKWVNIKPTISGIDDQTTNEDVPKGPVPVTVGDVETYAGNLVVTAASSDTSLLPDANITLGGSGTTRTVTLTPSRDRSGVARVTLTVSDGTDTASTSFNLTVTAVNDKPVAVDQAVSTNADTRVPLILEATDVEGDVLSYSVVARPTHGTLSGNAPNLTYMPASGYTGADSFTFHAKDAAVFSNTGTVSITVKPVNSTPTISGFTTQTTTKNLALKALGFKVSDVQTLAASLTVSGSSSNTALVPNENIAIQGTGQYRTVTLTPAQDQTGLSTITLSVSDGELSTSTSFKVNVVENRPPVTNAGPDRKVAPGQLVKLEGRNSTDPEKDLLTYQWTQTAGPAVVLSDSTSVTPTFTSPKPASGGTALIFVLKATDPSGLSSQDSCIVNVASRAVLLPPIARTGTRQVVAGGAVVTLDGSSSVDPQGNALSYQWTQSSGTRVTLSDPKAAQPTFTAPAATRLGVPLIFKLIVTSQSGMKAEDICIVSVTSANQPPTPQAGADLTVREGSTVTLDGKASKDADGGLASVRWSQVSGLPVKLSDPTSRTTTFTAPPVPVEGDALTFRLTATDSGGLVSDDICVVNVKDASAP
ncbi:MAG: PKD domain-containing protein [Acidobacteriota bacterium]